MTDTTTARPDAEEALAPLSTAPAPPQPPLRRTPLALARNGWRQLTSMRTALVLLFLLALAAVPGSVIPQRGLNPAEVARFFVAHPHLAPVMDRLWLFDVFAAPWFAAIYLLLFVSLIGCLAPRLRLHARALRSRPPAAPRRLDRLPAHDRWATDAPATAVLDAARDVLRARRYRVAVRPGDVGAEKGYLRETGNLAFHLALLLLLVAVALGGLFGYKGTVLVTEGSGFANTRAAYDEFQPARLFGDRELAPFSVTLQRFHATYQPSGEATGFDARIHYRSSPDAPQRGYDLQVNHPLDVGGAKVYLIGHGFSPHIVVRDRTGRVLYDAATPFLPQDAMFTSSGVVKVPSADGGQDLGLQGFFYPTVPGPGQLTSAFPAPRDPGLVLTAWHGDLGLRSGVPQSVYRLDTDRMTQYTADGRPLAKMLRPGQSWTLPDGSTVTFAGYAQFATFQVTHDPGKVLALLAAVAMLAGLLLSLRVRRRRVWVRATAEAGRTVVSAGGLPRTDAEEFRAEFRGLCSRLRVATGAAVDDVHGDARGELPDVTGDRIGDEE